MRAGSELQLLERESELRRLERALTDAAAGAGRLIVIEAAAGLGKTCLLEAALTHAEQAGMAAAGARGTELEREFAFGVVRQLLEPRLATADDDEREALFQGAASLARRLFEGVPDHGAAGGDPTFATLHGLYWLVSNLASARPLVMALDDAQWADAASLRFLAFLLPRLSELPVALLLALRTAELGTERAEVVRLSSSPEAVALNPRPLSLAAVSVLTRQSLGEEPAPAFAAACHKASAGNPFYLHTLLRELQARGMAPDEEDAAAVAHLGPRGVSRAVLLRLSTLDPQAPALARALAVLGDGASPDEAAELAGVEQGRVCEVCDRLMRAAVLRRAERLEFLHPIVRESVYADLAPNERAAEHARAARTLAAAGADPERVAAQLLEAAPSADSRAVEQLREAARRAMSKGAPDAATRHLRRALEEPPEEPLRPRVLLELGAAAAAAGEPDALERLREAFDGADEPEVIAAAAFEMGRALLYFARPVEAVEVLEEALERLGGTGEELRGPLEGMLLMQVHSDITARRLVVDRLAEVARTVESEEDAPAEVLATLALDLAQNSGPVDRAADLATRSLEDGRLVEELAAESPALYFATCALTLADRGEVAERYLRRALEVARMHGSARGFAFSSCCRGWTRYRRGDLAGAVADLEAFVVLASELSLDILYPLGLAALVGARLDRGEREAAEASLRSVDPGRWDPGNELFQVVRVASAHLHLAYGKPGEALEEVLAVGAWEKAYGSKHDAWTRWRSAAVAALAALGERDEAARVATQAVELARSYGAADYLGLSLRMAGAVAGEAAIDLLREAADVLGRSQARQEHARALVDLGAALRRANHRSEAREPLLHGLELARACGAKVLMERAGEELEAAGARPRGPRRSGVEALTPSERRIARLASEGLSNRAIAQALFVTQKTVEMHLSNTYRKLGIRSRDALAERLEGDRVAVSARSA